LVPARPVLNQSISITTIAARAILRATSECCLCDELVSSNSLALRQHVRCVNYPPQLHRQPRTRAARNCFEFRLLFQSSAGGGAKVSARDLTRTTSHGRSETEWSAPSCCGGNSPCNPVAKLDPLKVRRRLAWQVIGSAVPKAMRRTNSDSTTVDPQSLPPPDSVEVHRRWSCFVHFRDKLLQVAMGNGGNL
jgi:hypothetical protein